MGPESYSFAGEGAKLRRSDGKRTTGDRPRGLGKPARASDGARERQEATEQASSERRERGRATDGEGEGEARSDGARERQGNERKREEKGRGRGAKLQRGKGWAAGQWAFTKGGFPISWAANNQIFMGLRQPLHGPHQRSGPA